MSLSGVSDGNTVVHQHNEWSHETLNMWNISYDHKEVQVLGTKLSEVKLILR